MNRTFRVAGVAQGSREPRLAGPQSTASVAVELKRLDEILLVQTATDRQPALAAYARRADGTHRPYGAMVLQLEPLIATVVGFPDPWLLEQCGLPYDVGTSGSRSSLE